MNQATLWLSILMFVTMAAIVTPSILRMNQGRVIRNTAIWVLIVLSLALFYHLFGPFGTATNSLPANSSAAQGEQPSNGNRPNLNEESPAAQPKSEDKAYTPPDE